MNDDSRKPWRAAVIYRAHRYLVGYYDTMDDATKAAEFTARMRSEDDVWHLEVDEYGGPCYRQYWYGRSPRGDWHKRGEPVQ